MQKKYMIQMAIALGLVSLAVLGRFVNAEWLHVYNLELVTGVSLVAAVFLHRYFALLVPLAAVFLSDAVIGNSQIALFTWSAFVVIGLSGVLLKRWKGQDGKLLAGTAGMGLGAALWFFAWTNFGVWALGDGAFYPKTWDGLMLSYTYGLPFFRATLVSGVVLAPVMMAAAIYTPRMVEATSKRLAVR
jgi:phosphoglycerol transferase MdoB-like AlkP superfamily enzyme